jgi:hypothetical protein
VIGVPDIKKTPPIRGPHRFQVALVRLGGRSNPARRLSIGAYKPDIIGFPLKIEALKSDQRSIRGGSCLFYMIHHLPWGATYDRDGP